jgi:hypothetical protein
MKNIKKLALLLLLLFIICFMAKYNIECLRIQGSWDLRGDPYIPYNPFISPWSIGTSFPKRTRPLEIGTYNPSEYYY